MFEVFGAKSPVKHYQRHRRQNGTVKYDSCSVAFFFCWWKPGGSIRKNGKLTDQVCFVYWALFILTELAKNHVQKVIH